jgi:SNF2 family DNA or RNA helicase
MSNRVYQDYKYKGMNQYLVMRNKNNSFIPPRVNEHVITHCLQAEERIVYETLKTALVRIAAEARRAKLHEDTEELKKLNSQKLTMVLYLREALVCPMMPIASVVLSTSDMKHRDSLAKVILHELGAQNLDEWINDQQSAVSSRMQKVMACADKHPDEHVIIYACFSSFLNLLEHFLTQRHAQQRKIYRMKASMTLERRGELLKEFRDSSNGILILSYHLGAEGLNLQFASTVLLVDFWWNASKIQQAIGRIFRFGQIAEEINVYFFTSNTGIEKILYQKQKAKLDLIEELKTGHMKTKIPKVNMDEIIRLITLDENCQLMRTITYY